MPSNTDPTDRIAESPPYNRVHPEGKCRNCGEDLTWVPCRNCNHPNTDADTEDE